MPYCRAWAFNVAAKQARSPVLVLHDNDMLVPADYASQLLQRVQEGWEVVNLKRFVFYLQAGHTRRILEGSAGLTDAAPAEILQNTEGGGSVAITREGYQRIGGLDESFVGWGGEDNEFWERAQCLRVWRHAFLPLVHLWHPAQPGKHHEGNETKALYLARSRVAPEQRIGQLRSLPMGELSGPRGWTPAG
jgi:GT2 family glycosyltransferase